MVSEFSKAKFSFTMGRNPGVHAKSAYRVLYKNEAGEEARRLLPYSWVQRIVREEASEGAPINSE